MCKDRYAFYYSVNTGQPAIALGYTLQSQLYILHSSSGSQFYLPTFYKKILLDYFELILYNQSILKEIGCVNIFFLYLLVCLDNGNVVHDINPDTCFLTKAKWPKIWNRVKIVF